MQKIPNKNDFIVFRVLLSSSIVWSCFIFFWLWQSSGADVNQKLFRGFSTTAAIREGHLKILEILLKSGASQLACEEALLEASCYGHAMSAALLMGSDLIRPHIALHALVNACSRGFVNVVDTLIKVNTF